MHIKNIYADHEMDENQTYKRFLLVRKEGNRQVRRNIDHYNLDMVIALGYRVQSQVATRFRRWATQRLHEYIQKGFAMDDERLKQGGNRYFRELLQHIRDIRSSERNFYQQISSCSVQKITSRLTLYAMQRKRNTILLAHVRTFYIMSGNRNVTVPSVCIESPTITGKQIRRHCR